ncbi:TP53-binding protein 1-like [Acanthaster planci]|uniref:TP53-binding protein 1-like n=1 Tax=Acanthaster planci TaxID=133434 RepID=A0A8B7ZPP4_ACAPL|nr:TP53-binding protein 1-like [Acanthaster planci]
MDSLPFSQSGLGTQGQDPCFVVMNSQVEESQDMAQAVKMSNTGMTGPSKQRMLWELAALRGTQPSPVLTAAGNLIDSNPTSSKSKGGEHQQSKNFKAREMAGSQPTNPQEGGSQAPNQGANQPGSAGGNDGTGGSNQGDDGQDAADGAAGGGGDGGSDGGQGGGGEGDEEEEEEDQEETGEETSQDQDTSSSRSSVPKLVPPPALRTPPRTVRVKEIVEGASESPTTSPDAPAGPEQSDNDQGAGSERGGGVSDAPTAVVGDITDEGQGAASDSSPPEERRGRDKQAGGSGLMDPPLHSVVSRKGSSETSHSSSSSHINSSSSYRTSHDSASSSLSSSLSAASSKSDGVPTTSSRFTQIKERPSKPGVPIPQAPSQFAESFPEEGIGDTDPDHPQSSQQDLFSDVEERKADRVRVLASETSASEDTSVAEVPPTPEAYKYGIQDTPPERLGQSLPRRKVPGSSCQQGDRVLASETSLSDDASITIIQPSPQAWGTVIANTPPDKIEQYSRSSRSFPRDGSDHTPSTPSETLGSLHLSGQAELRSSEESGPSIVPPTLGAYGSIPKLVPSTPTAHDEEEPMELSIPDAENVGTTTHPAKRPKSTGDYDDEYGIPEWQQALNKEDQAVLSRSSSKSSSQKTTSSSSSEQSSEFLGRISAQWRGQQMESFQAWQPSSQQTTSTTSEGVSRSRPPSTQSKSDASWGKPERDKVAEKPRSASALEGKSGKEEGPPSQRFLSQLPREIPAIPTPVSKSDQGKPPPLPGKPAPTPLATSQPHQDPPGRSTERGLEEVLSEREASQPKASKTSSSWSSEDRQEEREEDKQTDRGGSSSDWMLHYTATQTETEPEAVEEETGKGRGNIAQHPSMHPPTRPPALPSSVPGHQEAVVPITAANGTTADAHTLMSYTDVTSSSTTASSDGKKTGDGDKELPQERRGTDAAPVKRGGTRTSQAKGKGPQSLTEAQATDNPKHSVSLATPGIASQSADPAESSSIDFHLSLPREAGFRPAGNVTLPSLAHRQKEGSSSRESIRHSTPIMEESPSRQKGQETTATSTAAQKDEAPKLVLSSTLTLGAEKEPDTQTSTETPVFQLERPSDAAQLIKAAHESPAKKSTSVFSKVRETKMAAGQAKVKGQKSWSGRAKYNESDDPFALSQDRPHTSSRQPTEHVPYKPPKQTQGEEEDEETIPVCYQEDEVEATTEQQELGEETGRDKKGQRQMAEPENQLEEERKKAGERTPEKRKQEKSEKPALSSRLTRSGQKRKLQEEQRSRRGMAKKTRFEEAERGELREKPPGQRDPYDFSDSQSNKTPSPMKRNSRTSGSKPPTEASPRQQGSLFRYRSAPTPGHKVRPVRDVPTEPATITSATATASVPHETPKRQKKDKEKDAFPPAQEKTPPVEDVLKASRLEGALPETKSPSVMKTSLARGKRAGIGRPRLASQQILQAQQDDSSPDFQPDQPREKAGVKFRRSPRKKSSQKQDKPAAGESTAGDPPLSHRHVVRQTVVFRVVVEKIIVDGKVVKTWETREQVEPVVETIEDEDSVDFPSPSRSISSLTSGSLADVSSMYSKTSGSSPSLVRTLSGSGGTLSKHSSFSSISRTGSSLSKQTVSSPGSDKSTPSLNKSVSSPGSDKSPGNEKKAGGELLSPGAAGPSLPRRVSFTRESNKPASLIRSSSGSSDETRHRTNLDPDVVFQRPHQTPRRKVDQQQGSGLAERMSLPVSEEVRSPQEGVTHEPNISATEVVKLVQLSQESAPAKETTREDRSPKRSPESKLSRRRTRDRTSGSSSSPHPASSSPVRRSSRVGSTQSERDTVNRRPVPRTRSTPEIETVPITRSVSLASAEKDKKSARRPRDKDQGPAVAAAGTGKASPDGSKKSTPRTPSAELSSQEQPRLECQRRGTRREPVTSPPNKEDIQLGTEEKEHIPEELRISSDLERRTSRSSRSKGKSITQKKTLSPTTQRRTSTLPEQSTKPVTSESSSYLPRDTLLEPPAGETLPVAEGEGSSLLPGTKVYTKWLDGFWYPGTILCQDKYLRYMIEFDDGDRRAVNERDIIIKEWLSRGQSVMAKDVDGYHYAGLVVGYYQDVDRNTSGYVIEQTDSHETSRYERHHVILTKDQAASLVSSTSGSSNTSGSNVISLDNVVYSKRTRLRSCLLESPSGGARVEKPRQQTPRPPQKTTPLRQGVKRKLVPSEEQPKKDTPSPRKRGRAAAQGVLTPSPELTISPRRSPRKRQQPKQSPQTEEAHPMAVHMGPLPRQATLFRNHAFLVTHGEVKKPPKQMSSSDESSGEEHDNEMEMVPFDRAYAVQQIQSGGGLVLSDFNKSQITKMKVLLIANTYCRTKKYFQALAAGIPCISHLWLRDCCKSGKLENYRSYLLPAGESLEENALMEIQPNRSILAGMSMCMVSDLEGVQDTWRSILIAAGCHMVSRLPSNLELTKNPDISLDCDVIVTDPSCPRSLLHRAQQLDIPVVSCEWVIQCLINGVRVDYRGHEKYRWSHRDKPPR